jgi:hypothetical protein
MYLGQFKTVYNDMKHNLFGLVALGKELDCAVGVSVRKFTVLHDLLHYTQRYH